MWNKHVNGVKNSPNKFLVFEISQQNRSAALKFLATVNKALEDYDISYPVSDGIYWQSVWPTL